MHKLCSRAAFAFHKDLLWQQGSFIRGSSAVLGLGICAGGNPRCAVRLGRLLYDELTLKAQLFWLLWCPLCSFVQKQNLRMLGRGFLYFLPPFSFSTSQDRSV